MTAFTTQHASFKAPTIETNRLIMRTPQESDLPHEIAFFASDASRFLGGPKQPEEVRKSFVGLIKFWVKNGHGLWSLEEKATGAYVGRAGLWFPKGWPDPEISWALMTNATGKGYATEAAHAARRFAYEVLGWTTAVSLIGPLNKASEAVAKRLGAVFEKTCERPEYGTMNQWRHPGPEALT
jgi:RimJ/RimL family protein N-acetyltransferase